MDAPTPQDGETDPFTLAAQERWLDLARLGQEAWNTWAEAELKKPEDERSPVDFSDQTIDVSNFEDFVFPAVASFSGATFSAGASFSGSTFSDVAFFSGATFSAGAFFVGATFSDGADFSGATFSDGADFRGATFSDVAYFSGATFSDVAFFRGATFSDVAYFRGATFSDVTDFSEATFSGDASFSGATVKSVWQMHGAKVAGSLTAPSADIQGHAYFTAIDFRIPPDLVSTAFKQPPSFLGSTFGYPCTNRLLGDCSVRDGEARFRRLKQLAADTHDHELELRLFAHETKAKRFHSLHAADPLHWPGLVLNFAYDWASDFGQSVLRPLGWLLVTVVCALFAYETMTGRPDMLGRGLIEFSDAAKVAAIANVFPFAGQAVIGREIMTTGLCPMVEGTPEHLDCLTALYTISAAEGIFGLIFLFLIGLGLRNRFRIK
ncbi:MAG: pentapeptide repeat-containing protein [Thalassobaculum sp.]